MRSRASPALCQMRLAFEPVSYTHLDVYKRQFDTYTQFSTFGQVVILLLIQVGGLGLVTLTTFFNIAVGRRPVSYTHLDVYKRQSFR